MPQSSDALSWMSVREPLLPTSRPRYIEAPIPSIPAQHDLSQFPASLKGKKILLCTESFGPVNGVSRTTLMILNHLRAHGAHIAVVAPYNHTKQNTFVPDKGKEENIEWDRLKNPEIRVHGYPLPFNPELSVVYPVRLSALYTRTFGGPPDIIYLASPASLGFQVMLQLRQQSKDNQIPVIVNFQTDLAGYCQVLFPEPLGRLASYTFGAVEGYLFRHPSVKTVFYPSRCVNRYLSKHGIPQDKMHVLRRGVNTELFAPSKRSDSLRRNILSMAPTTAITASEDGKNITAPDPAELVFVTVSRLAGEKGFDFLAQATSRLAATGLRFRHYIVGSNRNKEVENEVRNMFDPSLVASRKVIFAGLRTGEALAAAYASADVFLHCSVTETFGLVLLESMASGVPVVARDEGGPSDIIVDGSSGFLTPPHDLDEFVRKASLLARDKDLRVRMSRESRRLALEATWAKIGNTVAWRMADCVETREKEMQHGEARKTRMGRAAAAMSPVCGWFESQRFGALLQKRIVDARLVGGLGVIIGFWGAVGLYLAFSRFAIWVRSRGNLAAVAGVAT